MAEVAELILKRDSRSSMLQPLEALGRLTDDASKVTGSCFRGNVPPTWATCTIERRELPTLSAISVHAAL
jgi:hypothetical protein